MPVISGTVGEALKAYKSVMGNAMGATDGASGATDAAGGGFGDMLKQMSNDAISTIRHGETATVQAASGKADITQVVTAVSSAQMTLQSVVSVRDQVINAYKSIIAMQI